MASERKIIWINKTADSKHLGRSEGTEKKKIFSHVQQTGHALTRRGRVPSGVGNTTGGLEHRTRFVESVSQVSSLISSNLSLSDGARPHTIMGLEDIPFRRHPNTNRNEADSLIGEGDGDLQERLVAESLAMITSRKSSPQRLDPFRRIFDPCDGPDGLKELRMLQFFRERTAVEWSGWQDKQFWQQIAPQLATSHPVVRHALVSLGAFHASFGAQRGSAIDTYRALSLKQATKAIACFNQDYGTMTMPAIFISSIALTAMAGRIDIFTYLQTMRVEFELMDQFRSQVNPRVSKVSRNDYHFIKTYLEPLIERKRSRESSMLDQIYALSVAPAAEFYRSQAPDIPYCFDSLWQARQTLEEILIWITYNAKTQGSQVNEMPADGEELITRWLTAHQDLRQVQLLNDEDTCSWYVLRASCRMAVMMIKTMHALSETIFDQYLDVFRELLEAFNRIVKYAERTSQANISFGIDSGFVSMVTTAARCCRDPFLRRQLIASLATAHRAEGGESAYVSSTTMQCHQKIEEEGIEPPPTSSSQIPAQNRIRSFDIGFYCKTRALRLRYLRYPFDPAQDVEEVWIPHGEDNTQMQYAAIPQRAGLQPDFFLGRGFASYLTDEKTSSYYTVGRGRFHFWIPRV